MRGGAVLNQKPASHRVSLPPRRALPQDRIEHPVPGAGFIEFRIGALRESQGRPRAALPGGRTKRRHWRSEA